MHEMQTIVTDVRSVCQSVRQSVTRLNSASLCKKTAEQTKILFWVNTPGVQRTLCYTGVHWRRQGGPGLPMAGQKNFFVKIEGFSSHF